MSRVDVLAVIRRHYEAHRAMAYSDAYSAQEAPRLLATLGVVAELVTADLEYDAAYAAWLEGLPGGIGETDCRPEGHPDNRRLSAAKVRRAAALARIGGDS